MHAHHTITMQIPLFANPTIKSTYFKRKLAEFAYGGNTHLHSRTQAELNRDSWGAMSMAEYVLQRQDKWRRQNGAAMSMRLFLSKSTLFFVSALFFVPVELDGTSLMTGKIGLFGSSFPAKLTLFSLFSTRQMGQVRRFPSPLFLSPL
jgi:hypothetical protein